MNFAWPSAEIAVMGASAAVSIIYRKHNDKAQAELDYAEKFNNPFPACQRGFVDELISPSESRGRIVSALNMLRGKKVIRPFKKHGNMPM